MTGRRAGAPARSGVVALPAPLLTLPLTLVLTLVLTLLLMALLPLASAQAVDPGTDPAGDPTSDTMPRPQPGAPWFGPELDIETAVPADYAAALGASPSSFTFQVDYPVSDEDVVFLERQVRAIAALGSVVVVDLQPRTPLEGLALADAEDLGTLLDGLHDELGTWFLARFGAEMNGSWEPWGQQPVAYTAAFRTLAEGLDATASHVETVWSPVYGSGYPYREKQGADGDAVAGAVDRVDLEALDTDGDGRLSPGDDPYGPYFPGDDVVDWVGLTLYRFGQDQGITSNVVPTGEYDARLAETWGYGDGTNGRPFYARFAESGDRPMLVQTAALYNPAVGGASELALKRSWWRQVFESTADYPLIALISWLEVDRIEPEVDTNAVDWRVTADPTIAAAIAADLADSTVDLGPVSTPVDSPTPGEADGSEGRFVSEPSSDLPAGVTPTASSRGQAVGGLILLALLAAALLGRRHRGWSSTRADDSAVPRDPRIDLVRGALLVLVVAGHVAVVTGRLDLARSALGVVPVAEGLVLLSGIAVATGAPGRALRRVGLIYATAVVTALGVYVVSLLPFVRAARLMTFGDPASGPVRDLFPDAEHLADYPTPWSAARRLLLLEMGPWTTSALGLFIVLGVAAPVLLALLRRRLWWLLVAGSWALWFVGQTWQPDWTPAQFADTYPPLAWQVLFVHGLVLGHHRRTVARWLRARSGTLVTAVAVASYAGVGVWLWVSDRAVDPEVVSGTTVPAGRLALVAVAAVVVFALVVACWRPIAALGGRLLVPVGRHALVVLAAHTFVLVGLASLLRGG